MNRLQMLPWIYMLLAIIVSLFTYFGIYYSLTEINDGILFYNRYLVYVTTIVLNVITLVVTFSLYCVLEADTLETLAADQRIPIEEEYQCCFVDTKQEYFQDCGCYQILNTTSSSDCPICDLSSHEQIFTMTVVENIITCMILLIVSLVNIIEDYHEIKKVKKMLDNDNVSYIHYIQHLLMEFKQYLLHDCWKCSKKYSDYGDID
ncbi:hypothetical protein QTN25_003921 [Entamoeba marina]